MNTQERAEREISLSDLFWSILLGWRKIICFGILFAVLLCGMRYFLDVRSYRASQNIDAEAMEDDLKKEEKEQLSDAVSLQERIDNYEKYQEKSAIMQIDPYAKPVLELQYHVQSDYIINYTKDSERDYTPELISMYSNYISGGEMAQKVIDEASLSVSREDFVELVSVSGSRAEDSGSIFFTISYADEAKLGEIGDVVKALLEQKSAEFQKVGSHKLQLINESQSVVVDNALAEKKNTVSNNVSTLETQLKNLKANLTAQQKTLFDIEVSEMRGEELEEVDEPGISLMYIILGGMAGVFLVCFFIACKMIFASKLQSSEEIRNLYGMRLLGEIEPLEQKKRFLSVIDNLILNLRNRGKKKIAPEQQIKLISASVALSCRQQGIDSIYMTGSEYDKVDKGIVDRLKKELSGQKIRVQDGSNMLCDASSLQAGVENGHIVLVEQKGLSTYEGIYAERDLVKEYKGEILGVVVLGA